MKRMLLALSLAACTGNADIGLGNQPVTCQSTAQGTVDGTVTNTYTHKSYTFGTPQATMTTGSPFAISLDDSELALTLAFPCGQPQVGTLDVAAAQGTCPLAQGTVSGRQQEVYGNGESGVVKIDQTTGCIAGRYDIQFGVRTDSGSIADVGELAGWFSVPVP